LCTQRHSNSDFASALSYCVGNHAINSYCGQQQRNCGKGTEQECNETRTSHRRLNYLTHGLHIVKWESRINRLARDSRLLSIGAGADEVMLGIISKLMGTLPRTQKGSGK